MVTESWNYIKRVRYVEKQNELLELPVVSNKTTANPIFKTTKERQTRFSSVRGQLCNFKIETYKNGRKINRHQRHYNDA